MTTDPSLFTDIDEPLPPKVLDQGTVVADRYRIIEPVGQGGMGVVYKAEHIHMDKLVALKMMLQQTTTMAQDYRRFQREAQAASLLDHPNIVQIHDFGFSDGQAYLCMDYLEGDSLENIVENKPLTVEQFRHIFGQACDALQLAHEKGIVHRDLKPSNIMITERRGDRNFVIILDFGLVKIMEAGSDHKLTATNMVLGSPLYMSPEQCRGLSIDQRSDIYSLGCVMYESLTGFPPLVADSIFDLMNAHISQEPRPIREMVAGVYIPPALERAILQAMAKSPADRPQSMKELAANIESAFSGAPDVLKVSVRSDVKTSTGSTPAMKSQEIALKRQSKQQRSLFLANVGIWVGVASLLATGYMFSSFLKQSDVIKQKADQESAQGEEIKANSAPGNSNSANVLLNAKSLNAGKISTGPNAKNGLPLPLAAIPDGNKSGNDRTLATLPGSAGTGNLAPNLPEARFESARMGPGVGVKNEQIQQQIQDADAAFARSDWAQARKKYEILMASNDVSNDLKEYSLTAKLAICAFNLGDNTASNNYLARFKYRFNFNSRPIENEPLLLWKLLAVVKQSDLKSDFDFERSLAVTALENYRKQYPRPDENSITMRIELSKFYADQGKADEAQAILEEGNREAENNFPKLAAVIRPHLLRFRQRASMQSNTPSPGFVSGFSNNNSEPNSNSGPGAFRPLPGGGFDPSAGSEGPSSGGQPSGDPYATPGMQGGPIQGGPMMGGPMHGGPMMGGPGPHGGPFRPPPGHEGDFRGGPPPGGFPEPPR